MLSLLHRPGFLYHAMLCASNPVFHFFGGSKSLTFSPDMHIVNIYRAALHGLMAVSLLQCCYGYCGRWGKNLSLSSSVGLSEPERELQLSELAFAKLLPTPPPGNGAHEPQLRGVVSPKRQMRPIRSKKRSSSCKRRSRRFLIALLATPIRREGCMQSGRETQTS